MNKKATAYPLERVIGVLILLVVLVVLGIAFFAPEGWLDTIAEKAEGFIRFIPGREEIEHPPGLEISEDINEAYDDLYKKLDVLSQTNDTECWLEYKEIPKGKNKIQIYESDGILNMKIINSQGQEFLHATIPNLKPCIIAGKAENGSNAAENFAYYHYLDYYKYTVKKPEKNLIYSEAKVKYQ